MASSHATFFEDKKTVENALIPNTNGYDIHFVFAESQRELATQLKNELMEEIKKYQIAPGKNVSATAKQFEQPIGPWKQPMWEIQLNTTDIDTPLEDVAGLNQTRMHHLHGIMKKIALLAKSKIEAAKLDGLLFIHANIWPAQTDMVFERECHFDLAWTVCGKLDLKDIWADLISMERFIKQKIQTFGVMWKDSETNIIESTKTHFRFKNTFYNEDAEIERITKMIMSGHKTLEKLSLSATLSNLTV